MGTTPLEELLVDGIVELLVCTPFVITLIFVMNDLNAKMLCE
jgi:hypothetical protein